MIHRSETHTLWTQQQLIREVEVNDENEERQNGRDETIAGDDMERQIVGIATTIAGDQGENARDDADRWDDHAPPGHDDTAEFEIQTAEKVLQRQCHDEISTKICVVFFFLVNSCKYLEIELEIDDLRCETFKVN